MGLAMNEPEPLTADEKIAVLVTTVRSLQDTVDLLTANMIKMSQAMLLTNRKMAELEARHSPIIIGRTN